MRIVIDMQGVQSKSSSKRGIGFYTINFVKALIRNRGKHEIILVLSGLYPEEIDFIRAEFNGLLKHENIRVWYGLENVALLESNESNRKISEIIREIFILSLKPDLVHISSLFEGFGDNVVLSKSVLSHKTIVSVTLFDLIPYIYQKNYLDNNKSLKEHYLEKINFLCEAHLLLAISESSRQDAIKQLHIPNDCVVNISGDVDEYFYKLNISSVKESKFRSRFGLDRPFIMYTGGIDWRKNIEGLIHAFSKTPKKIHKNYQLVIVCSIDSVSYQVLEDLVKKVGLDDQNVIFTGFISKEDLRIFYNICSLFVFPSFYEGFGMPVLEAMRCGAPVIGANSSSIIEIINFKEALFEPQNYKQFAKTMTSALLDKKFRKKLIKNSSNQAKKFSWNLTAKNAIAAMENEYKNTNQKDSDNYQSRPKLAYISPLPPEQSGISNYSAELLPELSKYYEIEVIILQVKGVQDSWIIDNCPIRSVEWFKKYYNQFDRILYQFGNSSFHMHMFDLIKTIPGVIVLHDFFLSGALRHKYFTENRMDCWDREIYFNHGYKPLINNSIAADKNEVVRNYPCCLGVIQDSLGVIVHSPYSLKLGKHWFNDANDWELIPLLRNSSINVTKNHARKSLGISSDDFIVCSFGILGPTKLNDRLLNAWLNSDLSKNTACHLIFVGTNENVDYCKKLSMNIQNSKSVSKIHISGWVNNEEYKNYLAAADMAIQLRTLSRGETSGAILDCMNYGLPVIVNMHGSMSDLDDKAVYKIPDEFTDKELIDALEKLWQDGTTRRQMGKLARKIILKQHNSTKCAELYKSAIEKFYKMSLANFVLLSNVISSVTEKPLEDFQIVKVANALSLTFSPRNRTRQLLVDISTLVEFDAGTRIQRVVKNILNEWILNPPEGFRVEPIYAKTDQAYCYARTFISELYGIPKNLLEDEFIDYDMGDIFIGLDLTPHVVILQAEFYEKLRRQGVIVKFVVYDLLPLLMPDYFNPGAAGDFNAWLRVVCESNGALCISKSVASELSDWLRSNNMHKQSLFKIDWFQLGGNYDSFTSKAIQEDKDDILFKLDSKITFLMVGTLEPRKGHNQALNAFDQLWGSNININLIIIGRQGRMAEKLTERIKNHPELNKHLIWLEDVNDDYLIKIYNISTCLISASEGEGFGLPIVEAAKHKLPIIARNIPVFREVAGEHAYYFDGKSTEDLVNAINKWLKLFKKNKHPLPDGIQWITWNESMQYLTKLIIQ